MRQQPRDSREAVLEPVRNGTPAPTGSPPNHRARRGRSPSARTQSRRPSPTRDQPAAMQPHQARVCLASRLRDIDPHRRQRTVRLQHLTPRPKVAPAARARRTRRARPPGSRARHQRDPPPEASKSIGTHSGSSALTNASSSSSPAATGMRTVSRRRSQPRSAQPTRTGVRPRARNRNGYLRLQRHSHHSHQPAPTRAAARPPPAPRRAADTRSSRSSSARRPHRRRARNRTAAAPRAAPHHLGRVDIGQRHRPIGAVAEQSVATPPTPTETTGPNTGPRPRR